MKIQATIAIPTYRRSDLLRRALESALAQTAGKGSEVLVVENPAEGLRPDERSAAERLCTEFRCQRLRYVRNESNLGMVGNWNRCLELARGEWLVILHDDDWLSPRYLEVTLGLAMANPALRLIGCEAVLERGDEKPGPSRELPDSIRAISIRPVRFLLGNQFMASGVMIHRRTALDLGGFDVGWFPTMDHRFWLRFSEAAPCARVQFPLVHYYFGDNASLQPRVLQSYVVNDWRQREELLQRGFWFSPALRWYSRIKVHREFVFLQEFFGVQLSWNELEGRLAEAGWRRVPVCLRWTYFPIRAILGVVAAVVARELKPVLVREQDTGSLDGESTTEERD